MVHWSAHIDDNTERPEAGVTRKKSDPVTDDPSRNAARDANAGIGNRIPKPNPKKNKRKKKRNKHQRLTSALNKSSDTGDAER